jgi:hypothetical protein
MPVLTWVRDGSRIKATHKTKSRTFVFTCAMTYAGRFRVDVFTQETKAQHAFTSDTIEGAMRIAEQFAAKRPKI